MSFHPPLKDYIFVTDSFRSFEIQLQLLARTSSLSLFSGLKYLKYMHSITGTLSISAFFCEKLDSSSSKKKKNQTNSVTYLNNSCSCFIYAYQRTKHTTNTQFQLIILLKVIRFFQDTSNVFIFPLFISLSILMFPVLFQSSGKK